jgi:hypothetical protein
LAAVGLLFWIERGAAGEELKRRAAEFSSGGRELTDWRDVFTVFL